MACIVGRYQGWWLWELQSHRGACACLCRPPLVAFARTNSYGRAGTVVIHHVPDFAVSVVLLAPRRSAKHLHLNLRASLWKTQCKPTALCAGRGQHLALRCCCQWCSSIDRPLRRRSAF